MDLNKRREPTLGIMRLEHYDDADVYRVACSCGDYTHDVTAWVEVKSDTDIDEVEATFFVEGQSPTWSPGWRRWRAVWNLLWHGYHRSEHTLLLSAEAAANFAQALQHSADRLARKVADTAQSS